MITTCLWGWADKERTLPLRRQLAKLHSNSASARFKMPIICPIPEQTLPSIVNSIQTKMVEANGRPNIHVIFVHPSFRMADLKSISDSFLNIVRAAAFHSKTFVIICDATSCFPNNGSTLLQPDQINYELRKITTQYAMNSIYVDLQQVIKSKDWTTHHNLRASGQVKLGQAIVRAVSGTPREIFEYG